jgi:Kef-type K+ transport system membrane component KefB
MTNYIILFFCVIIILAYIFDISSKFSRIPGVILMIALGMVLRLFSDNLGFQIPNLKTILPVIGTLGLIMIVMEASLDINLDRNKGKLIIRSVSSAFILLAIFVAVFALILVRFFEFSWHDSILNAIPFGIVSSSVAIASAVNLKPEDKEFVVYESSFSDILGIMAFEFILLNHESIGLGIFLFIRDGIFTLIIAMISTALLGYLLHKITYHVNYVIILTFIILIYVLAELIHLPALLLILIFGLVMANNKFLENELIEEYIDFLKFRDDIKSFKRILGELTFLVRSFFFIMFGFYTNIYNLFNVKNLVTALLISLGVFILRLLYLKKVLGMPVVPIVFFAPRGLITILLFLSIPVASTISIISEEVVTLVILITIVVMMIGSFFQRKEIQTAALVNTDINSGENAEESGSRSKL